MKNKNGLLSSVNQFINNYRTMYCVLQVARFKENELARMRMEERESHRQELDKLHKEVLVFPMNPLSKKVVVLLHHWCTICRKEKTFEQIYAQCKLKGW